MGGGYEDHHRILEEACRCDRLGVPNGHALAQNEQGGAKYALTVAPGKDL